MTKPNILAITSELPWPLNTGGHIRTYHIMKSIAQAYALTLVVPVSGGEDDGVAQLRSVGIEVVAVPASPRTPLAEAKRVLMAAIRQEPYVMFHRHNRAEMRRAIQAQLAEKTFGAVYLDHLDPFAFRNLFPNAKLVVDLHNVYSLLAERVAEEHSGLKRVYLHREARLLAKMERQVAQNAAAIMAVSSEEQEGFRAMGGRNVHMVANGVDCSHYFSMPLGRPQSPPVLLYLGALSWQPNAQAAKFLAQEVIGPVRSRYPDAVLKIVGRDPDAAVLDLASIPGVEVHANVPDIGVYLQEASVLAVALDSGGGTRLKILEAFAAGLPVISTATGCEGIACEHDVHLIKAERDAFADAVDRMVSEQGLAQRMAEDARRLVAQQYDWGAQGLLACKAIHSVID